MHVFDAIVIGAGPAGCSAAIYASRASLDVLVLEQGMPGGQISTTEIVENYPGIPSIAGAELGAVLQHHAELAGASFGYGLVSGLSKREDGIFVIETEDASFEARSVIAACGASPRAAGFKGEDRFRGRGVSYCATCDAMFFRGKRVFVIGGGTTACEEAVYLARVASSVELIVRKDACRASKGVVDKMLSVENIKVRYLTSIIELRGSKLPETVVFRDNATGESYEERYEPGSFGVFVFTGNDPMIGLVAPYADLGPDGGVLTDELMATKTPGLFCAGDIRAKPLRQAITAAADGALAGTAAYRYVEARFRA